MTLVARFGAAGALLAAISLGGCMQTATYGTGESPERAIFREVTGGLVGGKKEAVVYQPRAPLVLPPSAGQLPAPAASADVAVAQWPDDPDEGAGRAGAGTSTQGEVSPAEYRRLRPLGQLARRPRDRSERRADDGDSFTDPVRQKKQREEFAEALHGATGISEERRYLTEPPDTVREPAATAPQQFEEIKKKKGNVLTRLFTRG